MLLPETWAGTHPLSPSSPASFPRHTVLTSALRFRALNPQSHCIWLCMVEQFQHQVSRSTVSSLTRETFPLFPVSNSRERTTGSTARLIQQLAMDRRPGPLAI